MTPNDYQQAALRTAPGDLPPERLLLNGLMGLNGEAGEAIDILKKHLFQGHELDTEHMAKELGEPASSTKSCGQSARGFSSSGSSSS